jgi:hypothetical protein
MTARRADAWLRLFAFGLLATFLVGALALSFAVTPEDLEAGRVVLSPGCALQRVFDRPCLGCGMTRAFAALGHGRLALAAAYNPLSPLVYAAFWLGAVYAAGGVRGALRDLPRGPA